MGLFTILVLIQWLERSAERRGKVTEFVNPRPSDGVNGSLCTDPGLGSWINIISQGFPQCGFTQESLGEVVSQSFYLFYQFQPRKRRGSILRSQKQLIASCVQLQTGREEGRNQLLVGLAPAQRLDLSLCSGKQIES